MKKACTIAGCDTARLARGLCSKHYQRARSEGMGTKVLPGPIERFRSKVLMLDGCWIWQGSQTSLGYGQFRFEGQVRYAHRWSYEYHVGPIPAGRVLDHLCRTPSCVNPLHLEPVSQRVNVLRGTSPAAHQAAWTVCKRGLHPLSGENLQVDKRGKRRCRACLRAWRQARAVRTDDALVCARIEKEEGWA